MSTEDRFDGCFWEKRHFFPSFLDVICKNLSNFWPKQFRKLVKIEVCVTRGISCGNVSFEKKTFSLLSYFEQKPFGLLARKFWQTCQKCNLSVQGNTLRRKTFFWRKNMFFLLVFGLRAKLFQHLDGNLSSIRLSNLHFTCSAE